MDTTQLTLTDPGEFVIGCNYWASHAGTAMWSDWQPEVVDADLKLLAQADLQTLRIFPLWPDFQPLTLLRGGEGKPMEFRFGEIPLPPDEAGQAGVSAAAIQHFADFADLAKKHGLKLIVGLVTGWMSGRLFVPPALEGRNVLTDALAIQWQVRFVSYFVRHFKSHPAILAWDLGNECNCLDLDGCHCQCHPRGRLKPADRFRNAQPFPQPGGALEDPAPGRADRHSNHPSLSILDTPQRPGPDRYHPHLPARHRRDAPVCRHRRASRDGGGDRHNGADDQF